MVTPFVLSGQRRIPLRNIWLLLLYASELFRQLDDAERAGVEDRPDDIPDLVAEILAHEVERRLARNLSYGWHPAPRCCIGCGAASTIAAPKAANCCNAAR